MERTERPKLKKAVVALRKLNLPCEVQKSTCGKELHKEIPGTFHNEDPNSKNISNASVESIILCTDDDDLEKKIQAFSIPINKDEKLPNFRNEKEASKICDDLDDTTNKGTANPKSASKQSFLSEKPHAKSKEKTRADVNTSKKLLNSSDETATQKLEIRSISNERKIRKEKLNKSKVVIDSEDRKVRISGNKLSLVKQQKFSEVSKSNIKASHSPTSLVAVGEEGARNEKVSITGRKSKLDEQSNTHSDGRKSGGKRKRKVQQEEDTVNEPINLFKRQFPNLSSETDVSISSSIGKKTKKSTEKIIKLDTDKKNVFPNTHRHNGNDDLKLKRSTRISARSNLSKLGAKHINVTKKLEAKSQAQALKVVMQKRRSNSKDGKDNSARLITANKAENDIKREKVIVVAPRHSINHSEPKDNNAKAQLQSVNAKNVKSQTSVTSMKYNLNANDERATMKRQKLNGNSKNDSSSIFEEGEDLLEKICDILEDTKVVSECTSGGITNVSKELQVTDHRTDTIFKDRDLILPSFLIPKMPNKSLKFPSRGKVTESYKKLWKWSHCVRLPSEMWSLYKHFNGNFVVILHISENSLFPNLLVDKCIIFNETASPLVKICGKDVDALGSKDELQTLGQVCSFLKHIHDLSLCEGRSVEGEENKDCELYSDKPVSLPFKCKYCSCS